MSKVPENLRSDETSNCLHSLGLERIHQGKVRDTYYLDEETLLVVTTDRISIFDFVLNAQVPKKGEVLTALSHLWLTAILEELDLDHHLIESEFIYGVNAAHDLRLEEYPPLPVERCLVVKNYSDKVWPFELIFRHHIGGSVFKEYQKIGTAGGHKLPPNLPKWSRLDKPIFTPSTKEEFGHDENVDASFFFKEMEKKGLGGKAHEIVSILEKAYMAAYAYAKERGILILDTKFEVAGLTIVDEFITPDSSRFCLKEDWERAIAEGRDPYFLDKQPVRDWGMKIETPFKDKDGNIIIGINKLDPKDPEHIAFVHNLEVPKVIISKTTERYLQIFEALTGKSLRKYQEEDMMV